MSKIEEWLNKPGHGHTVAYFETIKNNSIILY